MDALAALVATAAPIPPISSPLPILAAWGTNPDPNGLASFAGLSPRHTAMNWRRLFFQGSLGVEPLVARISPHVSTFICSSRLGALVELAPRLTQLDAGKLFGQRNCFALIGPRQTGKTAFLRSVAYAVARASSKRTVTIFLNYTEDGVQEPLHLLQHALQDPKSGVTLPPALCEATASIKEVLSFMTSNMLGALLCIDDVEALYRYPRDSAHAGRVFQQLRVLGSYDGPRPVMAVLTGSAAVLRVLLFAIVTADHESTSLRFPGHLRFGSLNDNKFVPLPLFPIVSRGDLVEASLCILSSFPRDRLRLEAAGCIVVDSKRAVEEAPAAASDDAAAPAFICCIARGCTIAPGFIVWLDARCRGLAGWIVDAVRNQMSRAHHLNRLLGTSGDASFWRRAPLERLLSAWAADVSRTGRDVATTAADASDESIRAFGMPIGDTEPAGPWYDLADAGVLRFEDGSRPRRVHFLHPSDAGTLLMALHGSTSGNAGGADADMMTPAEMLSLLAPQLASADEVNERLVMEALSWASQRPEGVCVRGRGCTGTFRGITHSAEPVTVLEAGATRVPSAVGLLVESRRDSLFKEFPDEQGSDGIGLVRARALTIARPPLALRDEGGGVGPGAAAPLPPPAAAGGPASPAPGFAPAASAAMNTLWRVQVKMSSRLGASEVSASKVQKWMHKMSASSLELLPLLEAQLPAGVAAVHVLWCAQQLTGPARDFLGGLPRRQQQAPVAPLQPAPSLAGHKRRTRDSGLMEAAPSALTDVALSVEADAPAFFLLVEPSDMLALWPPRVRKFVCGRCLLQYGAPRAAAGGGQQ